MTAFRQDYPDHLRVLLKDIGARLRHLRRRRGLTQKQVAARVPMHIAQYRHLEQGRSDVLVSTLQRVAAGLNVPAWTLLRKPRRSPASRPA